MDHALRGEFNWSSAQTVHQSTLELAGALALRGLSWAFAVG